ncbi:unnamed protein product, partial [Medioppia subpectinata]
MQYSGARKFVVTSRSGLKTDYQKFIYNRFNGFGERQKFFKSQWIVSTANGFTIEGTKQLLNEAKELGPIGGFCSSIDTKYKIFANLDQLTRQLDYKLDYFVVFSSLACGKGSAGQSNYAFGNSMCERICEERRRDGLHGLAIQYGPIGDVGAFVDSDQQMLSFTSIQSQRINSCCDVLDKLLAIKQPIVTSYVRTNQTQIVTLSHDSRVIKELWRALGIDPETTPNHLTLGEIGIESMFAVKLQQELEREWNIKLSLNQVKSITIGMLKGYEAGNKVSIEMHLDSIRRCKANLLKLDFIIPDLQYTKLNAIQSGIPVYFMPTLLVSFAQLTDVARRINRPVIGLNWTREVSKLTTLNEINKYYQGLIKLLEGDSAQRGKCDVVGYFDTAIACGQLLLKGQVGRAVIIDFNTMNSDFPADETENLLEFLLNMLSNELPESLKERMIRALKQEPNIQVNIKYIANEMIEFAGKGLVATHMEEILHSMLDRIRMLCEYRLSKKKKLSTSGLMGAVVRNKWSKMRGKLLIIKPFAFASVPNVDEFVEKTRHSYFLPSAQDCSENITIDMIDADVKAMDFSQPIIADKIIDALK